MQLPLMGKTNTTSLIYELNESSQLIEIRITPGRGRAAHVGVESRFENWTLCVLSLLRRSGGINQSCCVSESCGELYPPPPVKGLVLYISVHGAYM